MPKPESTTLVLATSQGKHANIPTKELGDFVADGLTGVLHLTLEYTDQKKQDKEAKVITAQTLWIPAVKGHGEFGRWAFLEIRDPWDAQSEIRHRFGNFTRRLESRKELTK